MRNLLLILALAVASLAACGPSSRDVALAKTSRYTGDKLAIFNAAKEATEAKYKLAQSDETTLTIQTVGKWYTPEGLVATSGDADIRQIPDQSINVVLVVKMLPDGANWIVDVDANMLRITKGSPAPEKLKGHDPSLPGWATGKVDELAFAIHDALKQYEVKAGASVPPGPAGSAAPAPTPAPAGSDAPPAAPAPAQ